MSHNKFLEMKFGIVSSLQILLSWASDAVCFAFIDVSERNRHHCHTTSSNVSKKVILPEGKC